jgi:hypothetical protein
LPPATYSLPRRLVPNYPLLDGGAGYVGHPALGDAAFAKATTEVLLAEVMTLVHALLDGRLRPGGARSPYYAVPVFRTDFWPLAALAGLGLAALAWLRPRR